MGEFMAQHREQIATACWQHLALVLPCLGAATLLAVALAVLVHRHPAAHATSETLAGMALTVPAFAVLAVLLVLTGGGAVPGMLAVTFFAVLPVLRCTLRGLRGIPVVLSDSARGIGMGRLRMLTTVELPLAWPAVLAGIRVSARLSGGVAALAAYTVGSGLGGLVFAGLAKRGDDAAGLALSGLVGVVVLTAVLDLALVLLGRLTTARGLRG
ncbi:ABC transporter permease subunit [Glutamicibacter protophormiae]|uniref:Choline transport system permease protein OpuBB n=1 Tax=Kocuria varians TaxID=1272 RepID=A0A7D7L2M6_KOCVA|nr:MULTISPECIES: ABC transporter permease subunit [Kocuria]WNB88055.1 ABC transporter permease subunit [Glutamicibacter protophormiae]MDN5630437.1 ABC transporter permease subunit [Kocuria sp.]QMS56364.1 Choline transport system permease protein OpuBB [Kocuria varians]RUP83928.1 ABC transporter permease subunit [Kocuria sp. HSID17590]RUQ03840.1 ABC transporter permease subunit [Kocuria sp. HSID17582]